VSWQDIKHYWVDHGYSIGRVNFQWLQVRVDCARPGRTTWLHVDYVWPWRIPIRYWLLSWYAGDGRFWTTEWGLRCIGIAISFADRLDDEEDLR
jgi:hypothetical protein